MIRNIFYNLFVLSIVLSLLTIESGACTNFLVTKGASADGSAFLTYTADAGGFMEPLYFHPGGEQDTTELLEIYEWDSG